VEYFIGVSLLGVLFWIWLRRPRNMVIQTIIDGDTFLAADRQGKVRKLRLAGVDCPEIGQPGGKEARDFAFHRLHRRRVRVRLLGRDRYRRYLCRIQTRDGDFCRILVAEGWAYPLPGRFAPVLKTLSWAARIQGKGVFGLPGRVVPWRWRRSFRLWRWFWRVSHFRKRR
jgi:micrococcal nuclease